MMPFAFLGTFGPWEMAIVGMVCLLIFGNRLPSVMRSLGRLPSAVLDDGNVLFLAGQKLWPRTGFDSNSLATQAEYLKC